MSNVSEPADATSSPTSPLDTDLVQFTSSIANVGSTSSATEETVAPAETTTTVTPEVTTSTAETTSAAPETSSSTSTTEAQPTTTSTTQAQPTTTSTTSQPTSTTQPDTSTTSQPTTTSSATQPADTTITKETTDSSGSTSTIVITQTRTPTPSSSGTSTSASPSSSGALAGSSESSSGLSTGGKIAVAVVVPIAAVAIFFIIGLYFWRKRRAKKDEQEQRKQDLKDYAYNPNDPTIPPVAGGTGDSYEMKEDQPSGYRGWGASTLASSAGRGPSTTMSGGGAAGQPFSDINPLVAAHASDTRSGEPVRSEGTVSPEGEILGVMGPPASQNRGGDIHRGASNASSHYSLGAGSEDSGGIGVAYGGPNTYPQQPAPAHQPQGTGYEQYSGTNPYAENPYAFAPAPPPGRQMPAEMGSAPVIRDNQARRTTQIQNAAPFVQQPGISQNF
ncbi:uncharacterized protein MKZ38_003689 [Zalerion maritima]|uniref:Uncharacterized protein n=1 Tax=Zalerion maritima TaxID=339359 RepID=A0AAD5RN57_9PEZI|nr:uncharacterized protein MKZ38_003689 [Zalerion maritima]